MGTSIVICGEPIEIGTKVVLWSEDDDYNLQDPKDGKKNFTNRRVGENAKLEDLQKHVYQVMLHHDATFSSHDCAKVLRDRGLSTHCMVDADGTIYQAMDLKYYAYHGGENNEISIGIDLCNPVLAEFYEREPKRKLFKKVINESEFEGLGYYSPQYDALVALLKGLCKALPRIKPVCPVDDKGEFIWNKLEKDGLEFEGIIAHYHGCAGKWDPGPGFDWNRVMNGLNDKIFQFPVLLPGAMRLSNTKLEEMAIATRKYYDNIEQAEEGGYYPIGINQVWHGGVHLHSKRNTPVYAMGNGIIVAARMAENTDKGSPNFVLIENKVKIADQEVKLFSLYMHLEKENFGKPKLPWVKYLMAQGAKKVPKKDDDEEYIDDKKKGASFDINLGQGIESLMNGDLTVLDYKVSSGEHIGDVGVFGNSEDSLTPQIHFEIFSADQVIPVKKYGFFKEVEPDLDRDNFCDIYNVWKKLDDRGSLASYYNLSEEPLVLSKNLVANFFKESDQRMDFRYMITFHISEWSTSLNWIDSIKKSSGYNWVSLLSVKGAVEKIKPFLWWSPRLEKMIGLPKDGFAFYYHPIKFLEWLTSLGSDVGVSTKFIAGDALKKELQKEKERGSKEEQDHDHDPCSFAKNPAECKKRLEKDSQAAKTVDMDLEGKWTKWEEGEWPEAIDKSDSENEDQA